MSTVTPVNVEQEVSRSLYRHIYNSVYSKPYSELRQNIHLDPLFMSALANSFRVMGQPLRLPSSENWYIYMVDNAKVQHVCLPDRGSWVCLADRMVQGTLVPGYCTDHAIDLRIVSSSTGLCLPRRKVFVQKSPFGDYYLIAISQGAARACGITGTFTPDDIWMSVYYHHVGSGFKVTHYSTDSSENIEGFINAAQADHVQVYHNGRVVLHPEELTLGDIQLNDYAEIVTDPDIVGYFDMPVAGSYTDGALAYTLFHIPKRYNPNNDILSHRVCDLVVYSVDRKNKSLYVTRPQTEEYFKTITHNDFGVHTGFLHQNAELIYQDVKEEDRPKNLAYFVRCYVRNHHREDLVLSHSANYLDCLYQLTDNEIISQLTGHGFDCWSAAKLVHSDYAKVLDTSYQKIVPTDLSSSVGALGYEYSAETLCKRVYHTLINPTMQRTLTLTLPMCYVGCEDLIAHVYIDGLMLDNDHITYKKDKQCLTLTFDESIQIGPYGFQTLSLMEYYKTVDWSKHNYFTVEVFEHVPYRAAKLTLRPGESTTLAVDQDYLVFLEVPLSGSNKVKENYLYKRFNVSTSYRELLDREYNLYVKEDTFEDDIRSVTVTNKGQNPHTFYVVSKHAYAKIYGTEHQMREMNYDIFCSALLTVDAVEFDRIVDEEIEEHTNHIRIPYLNRNNQLLCYLNHRELVNGLDCGTYSIDTTDRCFCGQFTVFQNVDYLTVANNILEVISIGESTLMETCGFATEGRPTLEAYWSFFKNTGLLFLDGKAISVNPDEVMDLYHTELRNHRKGASAKLRAFIPQCLKQILDKYGSPDPETTKTVLDFMDQREVDTEDPAIISRSHHIYSIFLQTVTEAVLRGWLNYSPDWTNAQIKNNLKPYVTMIKYDLGLSDKNIEVTDPAKFIQPPKSGIDYRFVDVLPSYRVDSSEPDLSIPDKFPLMVVDGSNFDSINGNFYCLNPDLSSIRPGERYKPLFVDRSRYNDNTLMVWENGKGSKIMHHNTKDGSDCHTWVMYDAAGIPRYHAHDSVGTDKIWALDWQPMLVKIDSGDTLYYYELPEQDPVVVERLPLEESHILPEDTPVEHLPIYWTDITHGTEEDIGDPITISTIDIVIDTAGEFPGYRLAYTTDIRDRNFLTKVANLYLNKDLVTDEVHYE